MGRLATGHAAADRRQELRNFGANVRFAPRHYYAPVSEHEVLEILLRHRGQRIRCVGRLHSWSQAPQGDEVVIDLRRLDGVAIERDERGVWATLGGGCQIKHALANLAHQGLTLPALGLISEQSIAGAVSTGTHGSGRHSMSHYVAEVRLAAYDPASGEPVIRTLTTGKELVAARCAVGCLGVILSVTLPVRDEYFLEEHLREYAALCDVLAAEEPFPLQQFFLIPWRWTFLAQHRRESPGPRSWHAPLYRLYWLATIDVGLHILIKLLVNVTGSNWLVAFFYRWLILLFVVRGWRVVDRSQDHLVMEHELFRHIEVEVFVRRSRLEKALGLTRLLIECLGRGAGASAESARQRLTELGLADEVFAAAGSYHHHYAICIRKVLADETLISPASGDSPANADAEAEPFYAISLISYALPSRREGFLEFARLLCKCLARDCGGRPHWGKVCPLSADEIAGLYPGLAEFRQVCRQLDPTGRFANDWTASHLLGEPPGN